MISLTNKEEKLIRSLHSKKFRVKEGLFFVEGLKMVEEAINSKFELYLVTATDEIVKTNSFEIELKACDELTMNRISAFKTAPGILAVLKLPEHGIINDTGVTLVIDKIQDPGNLGTIIRTADAFGLQSIVCSDDTVDQYSPKVVQASMGSIFRMNIVRTSLVEYLKSNETKVYAAHLDGENIYEKELKQPSILIVGNESQGIQDDLLQYVDEKVKIPITGGAESFNVSIATAIILSEFNRQLT